ncbi:MAG: metal ABC transporter ATP-binding protein [Candidatus Methylomirabilis sp.]
MMARRSVAHPPLPNISERERSIEHTAAVLKTTGLSLAYGRRIVLEDVDLEVRQGEFCFFLGPNGSGKTTLIRTILGVLRPHAGRLWLHPDLAHRERLGFVPQRCDINPTLPTTVREFVLLGLVGIAADKKDRVERLSWALDKVGLGGLERQSYWLLSGGQRQRALVARALVRRPSLLILDEPTNGLDLSTEDSFLRFLADLNEKEHLTLLFVTHDVTIAARYATHIALFHSGSLEFGPREDMLKRAALERVYGVLVDASCDASGAVTIRVCPPGGDR